MMGRLSWGWKRALVAAGVLVAVVFQSTLPVGAETGQTVALPSVLSQKDADLYRQIFSLQREGKWEEAENLLEKVENDLLKGRVLAQRYLRSYNDPDPKVLAGWLEKHGDNPEAEAVYMIARGAAGSSAKKLPSPKVGDELSPRGIVIRDGGANWSGGGYTSTTKKATPVSRKAEPAKKPAPAKKAASPGTASAAKKPATTIKPGRVQQPQTPAKKISFVPSLPPLMERDNGAIIEVAARAKTRPAPKKAARPAARKVPAASAKKGTKAATTFLAALRKDDPEEAEKILAVQIGAAETLSSEQEDMKIALGVYYLTHARVADAVRVVEEVIAKTSSPSPNALWIAGLAEWKQGRHDQAGRHFEAIAKGGAASGWLTSAAAYWAARSDLVARRPEKVNGWLETAAAYPRTFYGILARRALAHSGDHAWEGTMLAGLDVELLSDIPGAKRALALIQIGETELAAAELALLFPQTEAETARAIQGLAYAGRMPELAQRFAAALISREDSSLDMTHYPLPNWQPVDGWSLDKALVYAFVRQESAFNVTARSHAGATGVMQLMPATARSVAGEKIDRKRLHDPEVNIDLGQKYLRQLLDDPIVEGNLFYLAASYNSGPGAVQRWKTNAIEDPLYFIETIPVRETRVFVQRVMTNLWIYRDRLGQPDPSLDAVVAGDWPTYVSQDSLRRKEERSGG